MGTFEITARYTGAGSLLDIPPELEGSIINSTSCGSADDRDVMVMLRVHADDDETARVEGERLVEVCGRGLSAKTVSVIVLRVDHVIV
jgi:hypothetical protein